MGAAPPLVLVVDDSSAGRSAKRQILRRAGYRVIEASSGRETVEAVSRDRPDAAVLDIREPGANGSEICRRIKASGSVPPIQVLQMSNTTMGDVTTPRSSDGPDAYLTKPASGSVLLATLDALVRVRRAEQLAVHALTREQAARAEAERANQLKDDFLSTLSHELRTPLNAVVGWIWQLRHAPEDTTLRERALAAIERSTRVQTRLIDDLLDFSRMTRGTMDLERAPVQLQAVIEHALETIRTLAGDKDVRFTADLAPVWVLGDAARLEQIAIHLLNNALQFTGPGGTVTARLTADERDVSFSVRDSGQGIAPDFLPHVFDQFRQGEGGRRRRHGGLGLGLAIVKSLVGLHGGSVAARSPGLGQGAEFTVVLPRTAAPIPAGSHGPRDLKLRGQRVLAVDDDGEMRDWLKKVLEASGATVTTAGSARDALRVLSPRAIDILVSDIGMPGQDGLELLATARQRGFQGLAVAVTAFSVPEDQARILAGGYDLHVAKPLDPARFVQRLVGLVRSRLSVS